MTVEGGDPLDLLIVGGGPAGMAAARVAASAGLSVHVVDEQPRPGGQILRQPPVSFDVTRWLSGSSYHALKDSLAAFEALPELHWQGGCSVVGLERRNEAPFVVHLAGSPNANRLFAHRVLIATGCYDLPVALPGWTLPGAMAAGGVQAFLKSQQIVPGERFVLAGTHPLMLLVAAQLASAGGTVAAVAFDQPRARMLAAIARHGAAAIQGIPALSQAVAAVLTLRRMKVPVVYAQPLSEIEGENRVEAVSFANGQRLACDRVALCYGFVPQSDLPRLAGAHTAWAFPAGGWATLHDDWMESSVTGLYVAGETSGVAGAAVAALEGELAGFGIVRAAGRMRMVEGEGRSVHLRRCLKRARQFNRLLEAVSDPREALARAIPPETILCRCEDATAGSVDAAAATVRSANAVKLLTRAGMGLCQGRVCEAAVLRSLARAHHIPPSALKGFTVRYPVRPVRIGDLLDLAPDATTPGADLG